MKKTVFLAILMVVIILSAQAQRRYGKFNMGGMSPTELISQIDQQVADMQKELNKLDKKAFRWASRIEKDVTALQNFNEINARRTVIIAEIEKLTAQKNELLINNTASQTVSVNTKDPVAMATAYYMVKVADARASGETIEDKNSFTGVLVNYWNRTMVVQVTGPGGFCQEFTLLPGSSRNPSYQEFEFQIPGDYTAVFSWANGATPITKKGGWPNTSYTFNGVKYDFKATQLGRF